jgi:general secretion pathway protein I
MKVLQENKSTGKGKRPDKTMKGFTLMEVMIAMVILAVALIAILQSQSQSISMFTDSRFMTTAALLAQSKMAEVEAGSIQDTNSKDGDFGTDYPDYTWHLEIGDTQIPKFRKIEITVKNNLFINRGTYSLVLYKAAGM